MSSIAAISLFLFLWKVLHCLLLVWRSAVFVLACTLEPRSVYDSSDSAVLFYIFSSSKFSLNLLNGRINEDIVSPQEAEFVAQALTLPSNRDIPGNRQNLEAKV